MNRHHLTEESRQLLVRLRSAEADLIGLRSSLDAGTQEDREAAFAVEKLALTIGGLAATYGLLCTHGEYE